jgi:membrane protein implicated in regulation of membrane protease activity
MYYINVAMLFSFLTVTATGFLRWIFKPWATEGGWAALLEAGCRLFGILHRWSGLIFVVLAFYHIYLHWNWIVTMTERMKNNHGEESTSCDEGGR